MELRDLIVTPIIIFLIYVVAYMVRPYVTDEITRKYFLPGLTVKLFGALALGFLYQFYYGGGDTFNYHTHGSRHIWEAFTDDPEKGMKLLLSDGSDYVGIYKYASQIPFYSDRSSYAVVKLGAILDLITFSSYSATACLFAVIGFAGVWLLFKTFYEMYPHLHLATALAVLFIPSVIFWGSGLLKDTITLACVGAATNASYNLLIRHRYTLFYLLLLSFSFYGLYVIKIYILLTLLPAVIVWFFLFHFSKIGSTVLKILSFPLILAVTVIISYFAMVKASEDNPKYSLKAIAKTAQITAYDIRYWTGRDAGSGYTLGDLDGTWQSMIKLGPQAINVSLFRPYLWEVRNPLMLLSAAESLALLMITLTVILQAGRHIVKAIVQPPALFCLLFSLTFAFAVGVSTFNFGTLTRYKVPMLSFYLLGLLLVWDYSNKERKFSELEVTE